MSRATTIGLTLLVASPAASGQVASLFELHGEAALDHFGRVAVLDDVDGDGVVDFLVGAQQNDENGPDAGAAYLYSGRDATLIRKYVGDAAGDTFGDAVLNVGDCDGDGDVDFAISATSRDVHDGSQYVRVFSGRHLRDPTAPEVLFDFAPTTLGALGELLGAAGDVDGDGCADLLVGCADGLKHFYVVSGKTGQTLFDASVAGDSTYGVAVDGVGDVNGDGYADFLVGSYAENRPSTPEAGKAWLYAGGSAKKIGRVLATFDGDSAYDWFGATVAHVGDLDHDGVPDFAIGATGTQDPHHMRFGYVKVYSGKSKKVIRTLTADKPGDLFGWWLSAGDWDGDGVNDVFVDARYADHGDDNEAGLVTAFSGADGSRFFTIYGHGEQDQMGRFDASGDFDHDGRAELLLGDSPATVDGNPAEGSVHLLVRDDRLAASSTYGVGFTGSLGVPLLLPDSTPALGSTFQLRVQNSAGAPTIGVLLIGSDATSTPTTLGGTLLVDATSALSLTFDAGDLPLALDVPLDTLLDGSHFFLQAVVSDDGAARKVAFTPGLDLLLGGAPW
jgi:hypothetical protein